MNGVIIAWNRKHKAGTEPKRLHDARLSVQETPAAPKAPVEILLPAIPGITGSTEYFTKLFSAFITLGKNAGLDFTNISVRTDFVFGLHCLQAAIARQAQSKHPLHNMLDGQQLHLHVPKYIDTHTPTE